MKNLYGLIGYRLSHSFSKKYFSNKFEKEKIVDSSYELFELEDIQEFPEVVAQHPNIRGINVTIPYKQQVMRYLDELDSSAKQVGAVNTIKFMGNKRIGYNTDYYGFKESLENWLGAIQSKKALILGTGGASRAVKCALYALNIDFLMVSREATERAISYGELQKNYDLKEYPLIINTTPLGMSPNVDTFPDIAYEQLSTIHFCYDLVYNPEVTTFMKKAEEKGAAVKNGLEMLHLQAEKSWEIWNQ
ncbi:shikimate dehydrogenase family protein [Catalinimonas niigatensis]|uniref:shikimate dehydrogenase family protein n=1 Tax=Catalinimonas niigatensis TaxID=1397264 RepID=UPI0026670C45|nr:shikimate dehydrogenase [Catalinimonas niigatensis]WPP48492.1 shikimate dehydrogenase [Catalinimonas niigatensis]